MLKWADFRSANGDQLRSAVRGAIEEASGSSISVDDPTADELIAAAQQAELEMIVLKIWIYDQPKQGGWSAAAFVRWAREKGFIAMPAQEQVEERREFQ